MPVIRRPVTDERIVQALAQTDITPELVEWHGDPNHVVTVRIELRMGRYAERRLTPWMDDDGLVYYLESAAADFDAR